MNLPYGKVHLTRSKASWIIECEPHVRAKLRRAFPRAPQTASHEVRISNTPENARDLEWFLLRYPMEVSGTEELAIAAGAHREQEQTIADLLARRVEVPPIVLAEPAREYQAEVPLYVAAKGGLLLADHVGVGKTVSAIACTTLAEAFPMVVVCPPHLMRHWKKFLNRFAPKIDVKLVLDGNPQKVLADKKSRQGSLIPRKLPDAFVISYFRLRTWAETLAPLVRLLIFEECQQLRSDDSAVYRACEHVAENARYRIGLSATPIYNYGSEFFNVINVLLPGALGSHDEFIREWCKAAPGGESRLSDPEQFGTYLRREGIMLRRTRKDVKRELPPVSKILHEIDADAEVLDKLSGDAISLAKIILASSEEFRGQKMQAGGQFDMLMRQATGIAKAPYVAEFVRLLIENGERVVLFGWHRAVYSIWMEKLKDFNPVMYTGSESPSQKAAAEEAFKEKKTPLFIMSLRSGAGVDGLQNVCRTAVVGEFDWSPGVLDQCIGRIDRDGQTEPVDAYYLASTEGSDPIMLDVLGIKREQSDGTLNPGAEIVERIDTGENNLRALAKAFLKSRGIEVSENAPTSIVTEAAPT